MRRVLTALFPILFLFPHAAAAPRPGGFEAVGLGGGGGMFAPAASPHDGKLLFVSCDMGGFYRSADGGATWRMLDTRMVRGSTRVVPAFDPDDPKRVFFANGSRLLVSEDAGLTFRAMPAETPWKGAIEEIGVHSSPDPLLLVGLDQGAWRSGDRGARWQACEGLTGAARGFFFPRLSHVVAGTSTGVFHSADGGKSFAPAGAGLPEGGVTALAGGLSKRGVRVYALSGDRLFVSRDDGETFEGCEAKGLPAKGLRFLGVAEYDPLTVWVTDRNERWGVWRSGDEGRTFENEFRGFRGDRDQNVEWGWLGLDVTTGWGGPAIGFSVNRGNPDQALYTNTGELFMTTDGGDRWLQLTSAPTEARPGPGQAWRSVGLEVTTTWQYAIDPFDPKRHYICYTDIGFARSLDGGETWIWSARGSPWANTFYRLVPDPRRKGVLYAAAANQHDIPGWTQIEGPRGDGGVILSTDHGASWQPISNGFPPKKPCTSIAVDFGTPFETRTIFAAVFGAGVFRTRDGGKTWERKSEGLGRAENMHCSSIRLAPDGALYCLVTGRRQGREFGPAGGLYVSRDGAETWTELTAGKDIWWPTEFALSPRDAKTILLSAADPPGKPVATGGLWRSDDGGRTWTHAMAKGDFNQERLGYVHAFQPEFDPADDKRVWFATWTHGLLESGDGGRTFREFLAVPFLSTNRVMVDAAGKRLFVCTYGGGVWRGPLPD